MDYYAWKVQKIIKNKRLLAEFKKYLLKHKHWPRAAQDGEGLASKQRVRYTCQRSSKQRLNGTLGNKKKRKGSQTPTVSSQLYAAVHRQSLQNLTSFSGRGQR